ncbi:MAG: hypothetical protein VX780_12575 [Pseudomonadota bacterium]|nr:hypothetical protein [Pseudomonadota bacterium]
METAIFDPGGYRYIRGPFQYSGGVAAEPGFSIERVRFLSPMPLVEGFVAIKEHLNQLGRPLTAFCACELRSPAPFTEEGFIDFNRIYVGTLERWEIFKKEENPVARSNVCPKVYPPSEPSFHSFSYTMPRNSKIKSFVIAGSAEVPEGVGTYNERIIRLGERSPDAMREKAHYVLDAMEKRMAALGLSWADAGLTQIYTVYEIHSFLLDEILSRGAGKHSGLTCYYARPPVKGLDYEMDVSSVEIEKLI